MMQTGSGTGKSAKHAQFGGIVDLLIKRLSGSRIKKRALKAALRLSSPELAEDVAAVVRRHVHMVGDTIHVDRSRRLIHVDGVKKPKHPELQKLGPKKYDLTELRERLPCKGERDFPDLKVLYEYLEETGELRVYPSLHDLIAIQGKGLLVFRKHFGHKTVLAPRSATFDSCGHLRMPALMELGNTTEVRWLFCDEAWTQHKTALSFKP